PQPRHPLALDAPAGDRVLRDVRDGGPVAPAPAGRTGALELRPAAAEGTAERVVLAGGRLVVAAGPTQRTRRRGRLAPGCPGGRAAGVIAGADGGVRLASAIPGRLGARPAPAAGGHAHGPAAGAA